MAKNPTQTAPDWQISASELSSFIDGLTEPHILIDTEYRVLFANSSYKRNFQLSDEQLRGRHCYEVSHQYDKPCDQMGESCPMALAKASKDKARVLHLHHTPHGEQYVNIAITPLVHPNGEVHGFIERMDPIHHVHHEAKAQGLTGQSAAFKKMLSWVGRVANTQASVLLLGETGTGKELLAQSIHATSDRRHKSFVPVDCSSLTETLFESELFGHEKGAFTDAHRAKAGLVETAHEGTLFLDEVGDIPLSMQVKLLRLLETGTYRRVGSPEQRHANVRIVSATHRNLDDMVQQGLFRRDLYHRLSTFPIQIPPLREREDDIPLLVDSLLQRMSSQYGKVKVEESALTWLRKQTFQGNIRELRNLLERAVILAETSTLNRSVLQMASQMGQAGAHTDEPESTPLAPNKHDSEQTLQHHQDQYLLDQLQTFKGSKAELARSLGLSERTLYRKIKELQQIHPKK
ncbi:MAG: hypothetical protein RLZZ397_794 [Pseudomonadota bacterium]|jgi:transcriptional regulator with PAS, ATPase and Fis domain